MEEQNEIKQAHAKDTATYCRCPECLHVFIPEETENGNAICSNCSKEVPEGNDFTLFNCSNCSFSKTLEVAGW
jgi:DNA-directed RNA polymerase subunit RPC12/RpoP